MGRVGFAREMEVWVQGRTLPKVPARQRWAILFGEVDPLFQASDCEEWWRDQIPNVKFDALNRVWMENITS